MLYCKRQNRRNQENNGNGDGYPEFEDSANNNQHVEDVEDTFNDDNQASVIHYKPIKQKHEDKGSTNQNASSPSADVDFKVHQDVPL